MTDDELIERLRASITERVAEGDGFWRPCSGCQESCDGCVSETDYPYSEIFKCQPGGGCGECGGIGVVWDSTDYEDYARFVLAEDDKDAEISRLKAANEELAGALGPFVDGFASRRDAYIKRYGNRPDLGTSNFDAMPDAWKMEALAFTMGDLRRAAHALSIGNYIDDSRSH